MNYNARGLFTYNYLSIVIQFICFVLPRSDLQFKNSEVVVCCTSPQHEVLPCLAAGDGQVAVLKETSLFFSRMISSSLEAARRQWGDILHRVVEKPQCRCKVHICIMVNGSAPVLLPQAPPQGKWRERDEEMLERVTESYLLISKQLQEKQKVTLRWFPKALVLMCHVLSPMWQTQSLTPFFSSSSSPHAWPDVCVRTDSVIVRKIAVVLTGGSLGNRGPQHDGICWALKSCLQHFYGDGTLRNVSPNDLYPVSVLATGVLPWIQESEGERL